MTIIEYAEKIDALKYLSDKMIKILELYQETKNDDANAFLTIGGLRNGKTFLNTLITKYEAYQQGKADAVDEFRKDVIGKIDFEDKWLFACKSNNADTGIMFSALRNFVNDRAEQLKEGQK